MYHNVSNTGQKTEKTMHKPQKWLGRLNRLVETALYTPQMNNLKIAEELEMSERDLFRKVKKSTGLSPQKYVRQYRLSQAMHYLKEGKFRTVKETCQAIGYTNVSHFIVQFEKEFGKKPFQVLREQGWR